MRPTIFLLLVAGAYGARIHVRGEDTSATTTSTGSTSSTPSTTSTSSVTRTDSTTSTTSTASGTTSLSTTTTTSSVTDTSTHSDSTTSATKTSTKTEASTTTSSSATATATATCDLDGFSAESPFQQSVRSGGLQFCEGKLEAWREDTTQLAVNRDAATLLCVHIGENSEAQFWVVASSKKKDTIFFDSSQASEAIAIIFDSCCGDEDQCKGSYTPAENPDIMFVAASIGKAD